MPECPTLCINMAKKKETATSEYRKRMHHYYSPMGSSNAGMCFARISTACSDTESQQSLKEPKNLALTTAPSS